MVDLNNPRSKNREPILSSETVNDLIKTFISYFALPLALPGIFLQECLAWFRQRTGLANRSLEGKVRSLREIIRSNVPQANRTIYT